MQPMSQAEVEAGEARQWLMQRGWSLEEVAMLEQSARSEGGEFNRRLLVGLGEDGVAELRSQLGASSSAQLARGAMPVEPEPQGGDLVCFLDGIGHVNMHVFAGILFIQTLAFAPAITPITLLSCICIRIRTRVCTKFRRVTEWKPRHHEQAVQWKAPSI